MGEGQEVSESGHGSLGMSYCSPVAVGRQAAETTAESSA